MTGMTGTTREMMTVSGNVAFGTITIRGTRGNEEATHGIEKEVGFIGGVGFDIR
jgi:hypothetical protein